MIEFDIQRFAENIYGTSGNDSITLEQHTYYFNNNKEERYHFDVDDEAIIYGYEGNDVIDIKRVIAQTIFAGDGDDTVEIIDSEWNIIYGGNGNDHIYNLSGMVDFASSNTIYGDEGNDCIDVSEGLIGNGTIDGGAGNDSITIHYGNVKGGAGDDIIYIKHKKNNYGTLYQYESGDGNDTIFGFNFLDTIHITSGTYSTLRNENDFIISVDSGSIILKNIPNGNQINIKDSEGNLNWSVMSGTDGDDSRDNRVPNVSIYGYGGNDTIYNNGKNVLIDSGNGSDSITNIGDNVSNNGDNVTIDSGTGDDTIVNYRPSVSINSGAGDDSIYNYKYFDYSSIKAVGNSVTIESGDGDDYIQNSGDSVTIDSGDGDDFIYNSGNQVTINSGDGNDKIKDLSGINTGYSVTIIDSGAGDDSIYVYCDSGKYKYSSINSGTGDDFVSLKSYNNYSIIEYKNGDGNDTIYGLNSDDTLQITGAKYTTVTSGDDLIFTVGTGKISIVGGANTAFTIDGTLDGGTDTTPADTTPADDLPVGISIKNSILTASAKFTGTEIDSADYKNITKVDASAVSQAVSIISGDSVTSIKGGKNSDIITGGNGKNTILGGAGNDSIFGGNDNDKLLGEVGDDTLSGGIGKNTLTGGNGKDIFVYDGGNDLITDYTAGQDKIKLSNGSISSVSVSGNNVILKTASGNITIQNGKDKNITVIDSSGNETTKTYPETTPADTTPADTLPVGISVKSGVLTASAKFIGTEIDLSEYDATKVNASALSQAVSIVGNDSNNSIKGGKGADTISGGIGKNTLTGDAGKDIFVYDGGNDLITDYKPGEDKIEINFADVTKTSVKGSDVILTTADGTISIKGAKDKVVTFTDGGEDTELIFFAGISYTPLETGLTYDAKRTVLTASNKFSGSEIDLENSLSTVTKLNASAVTKNLEITSTDSVTSIKGGKGADVITGGNGKNTIYGGAGNDSIFGGTDNDKLYGDAGADTISGGSGTNTLTGGAGKDVFVHNGGNDFIADYKPGDDTIILTNGAVNNSSLKGSDIILYTDDGEITVKGGKGKKITVTDGAGDTTTQIYGRVWYSENKNSASVAATFTGSLTAADYDSSVEELDASQVKAATKIFGNDNDNTILGSAKTDSIYGGNGDDSIFGGAGNDKLFGEVGDDSLNGGKGSDTLTGGAGNDVFIYSNGDGTDVIADFVSGEDVIKLESGTVSNYSVSGGKDAILKIGSGKITLKNIGNEKITVIGADNSKTVYGLADGLNFDKADLSKAASLTISSDYESEIFDATNYKALVKIDASAVNGEIEIIGNAKNNSIIASKGGSSLNGGKGNDTLIGGDGSDVFIYSAGKDVIENYSVDDTIKISSGKITKTEYKGDDVIFTVGSGSITVKDGKGKNISVTDSSRTKIYSKTFDLLYDNNFVTDEFNLNSICEQKYSVTQIQTSENSTEFNSDNLITYGENK